ncbi:MAG: preprotein translocase subunit YajC [Oscillospiraceae bacterium]
MYFLLQAGAPSQGMALFVNMLPFVLILVVMYFFMIRPQKKKDQKTQEMRKNLEIGDGVTTIGGIVGRVVAIKEDTVVVETGTDRSKIRFKRWAISDVEKLAIE